MVTIRKGDTVEFRVEERHLYGEIIKIDMVDEETGEEYYRIACGNKAHPKIYRNVARSSLIRKFHNL